MSHPIAVNHWGFFLCPVSDLWSNVFCSLTNGESKGLERKMSSQATSWAEMATGAGSPVLPPSDLSRLSGGSRERGKMFTSLNCRFFYCSYFGTSSSWIFTFHLSLLYHKWLWSAKPCNWAPKSGCSQDSSSLLLLRDHSTQSAGPFQHTNTVPPLGGFGEAVSKTSLPVRQELVGAGSWVTGHMKNICRQHHPLMETSVYVGSKSPRQGPFPLQPSASLKDQETSTHRLKPAQLLQTPALTFAVHSRVEELREEKWCTTGTIAISSGLTLIFRLPRRWTSLPPSWQLQSLLLIWALFSIFTGVNHKLRGKIFQVAHLPWATLSCRCSVGA